MKAPLEGPQVARLYTSGKAVVSVGLGVLRFRNTQGGSRSQLWLDLKRRPKYYGLT
jgi:hypothetical protein